MSYYSAPQCSHCKRCTSYSISVCPSLCPSVRPSHAGIALIKGRHLYSSGRPSRWALSHILVSYVTNRTTAGGVYQARIIKANKIFRPILLSFTIRYDTIRLDILTCAQKLTGSQLNPPHGTSSTKIRTRMWANAQRDGHPAKYG